MPVSSLVPDDVLQAVSEIQLESARLGGSPCRACAWVYPTHVKIRANPTTERVVEGVRPWRGMALFSRAALPTCFLDGGVYTYEGAVVDGDTVRQVRADVFLHYLKQDVGTPAGNVMIVEFVGAGTLR